MFGIIIVQKNVLETKSLRLRNPHHCILMIVEKNQGFVAGQIPDMAGKVQGRILRPGRDVCHTRALDRHQWVHNRRATLGIVRDRSRRPPQSGRLADRGVLAAREVACGSVGCRDPNQAVRTLSRRAIGTVKDELDVHDRRAVDGLQGRDAKEPSIVHADDPHLMQPDRIWPIW